MVIALVRAFMISDPEGVQRVGPYKKLRWIPPVIRPDHDGRQITVQWGQYVVELVGGHQRRAPNYKRAIDALACVCKQEELAVPQGDEPLLGRKRKR